MMKMSWSEVGFSPFNAESAVAGAKGGRYKLDSLVAQGRAFLISTELAIKTLRPQLTEKFDSHQGGFL